MLDKDEKVASAVEQLKRLELIDLYKVMRLSDYAQSGISAVVTDKDEEQVEETYTELRTAIELLNQHLTEADGIIDTGHLIDQINNAKTAFEDTASCTKASRQDRRQVRLHLMSHIEDLFLLKELHQTALRLVRKAKIDKLEKAKLYLQYGTLPNMDRDDVEALPYLRSRGITCREQQTAFVNRWETYVAGRQWLSGYGIIRVAEHCHVPDITQWWEQWFTRFDQQADRRSMDKIKAALILFDLCRSKYGANLLGDDHPKAWQGAISFFNELYFNPADQREGLSPIILAATLFAAQMTASPLVRIEMLEESLQTLVERQSRDGGWPYSQRMRNKLSVLSTVLAIHAIAALRPQGWQAVLSRAKEWILRVQCDCGFWSDIHFKNHVYLTVLALDAIDLAEGKENELSFSFDNLPKRSLSVSRPATKESGEGTPGKERRRGRGRRYSDKTLEKVNALHNKYAESCNQAEAWSRAAKECNMESGDAAKMQVRRYMKNRTQ